jgi:hypothetical protein
MALRKAHPGEMPIPATVVPKDAVEVLRLFGIPDKGKLLQPLVLSNPMGFAMVRAGATKPDKDTLFGPWGVVIADVIRQIAQAGADFTGKSEKDIEEEIVYILKEELLDPTGRMDVGRFFGDPDTLN